MHLIIYSTQKKLLMGTPLNVSWVWREIYLKIQNLKVSVALIWNC
jgi:hypothetical protein